MAVTINATAGDANANSFVTEAEAIAYMATRLNVSGWTTVAGSSATETEKVALIEATRELSMLTWVGWRVTATQSLSWPRQFVVDIDAPLAPLAGTTVDYPYYAETIIPQRVKDATMELALQFLKAGTTDLATPDLSATRVRRKKVDVLETEYFEPPTQTYGLARYPRVMERIAPLLENSGNELRLLRS